MDAVALAADSVGGGRQAGAELAWRARETLRRYLDLESPGLVTD